MTGTTAPAALPCAETGLLQSLGVFGMTSDSELEGVVRVAATVAGTSSACVNLFDGALQRQLSPHGFRGTTSLRADSLCAAFAAASRPVTTVPDLAADPGLAGNPWVDGRLARARGYASAPIVVDGTPIGALCVFDARPRRLDDAQAARLVDLATVIVALLQRRRQAAELADLAAASEVARLETAAAHERLARSTAFTAALLDALPVGVVAADAEARVNLFNRVSREWHGLDTNPDVPLPDAPSRFALTDGEGTPIDVDQVPLMRVFREGRITDAEMGIRSPEGDVRLVSVSGGPVHDADGRLLGAVVAMADVTGQRALEDALRAAALHDPLTGVPNRTLLLDRLDQLLTATGRSEEPLAVLYCDLDGFKPVNDTAGHAAGDDVLVDAVARLRAAVRPGDTVARVGGDEFVLLCPGVLDEGAATDIADRVTRAFDVPLRTSTGTEHRVGISVGVALCAPGDGPDEVLRRADAAMYRVKARRRRTRARAR
ncbi:diguanylate cyclase domain-containing protein [Blastococcus sp. SYSU D00820]